MSQERIDARRAYYRQYYTKNREHILTLQREKAYKPNRRPWLKELVERLKQVQNNRCAICQEPKKLCVDHDHACCSGNTYCPKCVRGLLCSTCNSRLGVVEKLNGDTTAFLNYLEQPPASLPAPQILPSLL